MLAEYKKRADSPPEAVPAPGEEQAEKKSPRALKFALSLEEIKNSKIWRIAKKENVFRMMWEKSYFKKNGKPITEAALIKGIDEQKVKKYTDYRRIKLPGNNIDSKNLAYRLSQ